MSPLCIYYVFYLCVFLVFLSVQMSVFLVPFLGLLLFC